MSEIKQLLILGDFCWLEAVTKEGAEERDRRRADLDAVASRLRDAISCDLASLEELLGSSSSRPQQPPADSSLSSGDLKPEESI